MMNRVVKFIAVILMVGVLSLTSSTHAYAAQAQVGNMPGTDQSLLNIQARRSQNKQMGDKAFRAEIIRKPEAITDLVCLPKLNGNFAGVATLFSDVKDSFSFEFSLNNLCNMAMGVNAGFGEELSGMLKVAATGALGLDIPALELCTNSLNIGIDLGFDLSGGFDVGFAGELDLLGCAVTTSVGIDGGFDLSGSLGAGLAVPSFCLSIDIPLFECQGIGQFAQGVGKAAERAVQYAQDKGIPVPDLPTGDLGKILPLSGGGFNGGVMYATQDEEISLLAGGGLDLASALGMEDIEKSLGFMTEVSLELDLGFSVSASTTDGLSSDGGVNVSGGAAVSAGTGDQFFGAYTGTENGQKALEDAQADLQTLTSEPGGEGSVVWAPFPTIGAAVSGEAVLDLMTLAQEYDPTYEAE